jgi:hypothetical protein
LPSASLSSSLRYACTLLCLPASFERCVRRPYERISVASIAKASRSACLVRDRWGSERERARGRASAVRAAEGVGGAGDEELAEMPPPQVCGDDTLVALQLDAHSCNRPCRACVLHALHAGDCLPLLRRCVLYCIYTAHIFTYIPARCAQACVPVCVCVSASVLLVAATSPAATNAPGASLSSSSGCASARVLAGAGLQLLLASPTAAACPSPRTRSSSSSSSILIFLGECGGDCDGRRLLRLRTHALTLPHHTPHTSCFVSLCT